MAGRLSGLESVEGLLGLLVDRVGPDRQVVPGAGLGDAVDRLAGGPEGGAGGPGPCGWPDWRPGSSGRRACRRPSSRGGTARRRRGRRRGPARCPGRRRCRGRRARRRGRRGSARRRRDRRDAPGRTGRGAGPAPDDRPALPRGSPRPPGRRPDPGRSGRARRGRRDPTRGARTAPAPPPRAGRSAQGLGQRHPGLAVGRVRRDEPPEVPDALVRLPDGVAGQAPVEDVVKGHRAQPRQGIEVLVELAAAEQHPVDVDQLPVRRHERRVELQRGQERRFRAADAVPPQLDLTGQQPRRGASGSPSGIRSSSASASSGRPSARAASALSKRSRGTGSWILASAAAARPYRPAWTSASASRRIRSGSAPPRPQAPHAASAPRAAIAAPAIHRHGRGRGWTGPDRPWSSPPASPSVTVGTADARGSRRHRLDDRVRPIRPEVLERADRTRRPAQGDLIHLPGRADADQQAGVIRRLEAVSPLALPDDRPAAHLDQDAGADRVAVAPGPPQLEPDPVVAGLRVVAQQGRRGVLVIDDDVDVAVVVDVAERRAAADVTGVEVRPGVAGRQAEALPLQVEEEQRRLRVLDTAAPAPGDCRRRGRWRRSCRASRRCRSRPGRSPSRRTAWCRRPARRRRSRP